MQRCFLGLMLNLSPALVTRTLCVVVRLVVKWQTVSVVVWMCLVSLLLMAVITVLKVTPLLRLLIVVPADGAKIGLGRCLVRCRFVGRWTLSTVLAVRQLP